MTPLDHIAEDPLETQNARIEASNAFKPLGVTRDQALEYLETAQGQGYLSQLRRLAQTFAELDARRSSRFRLGFGVVSPSARSA